MKTIYYIIISLVAIFTISSCATSNSTTTLMNGISLNQYQYVVFGTENNGDAELDDILLLVQNEISTKLTVVSPSEANSLILRGISVLTPRINAKSEKWEGGHTYITISFYDFEKNVCVAVVKSSGIGLSISHDQSLALSAIQKELNKAFKK